MSAMTWQRPAPGAGRRRPAVLAAAALVLPVLFLLAAGCGSDSDPTTPPVEDPVETPAAFPEDLALSLATPLANFARETFDALPSLSTGDAAGTFGLFDWDPEEQAWIRRAGFGSTRFSQTWEYRLRYVDAEARHVREATGSSGAVYEFLGVGSSTTADSSGVTTTIQTIQRGSLTLSDPAAAPLRATGSGEIVVEIRDAGDRVLESHTAAWSTPAAGILWSGAEACPEGTVAFVFAPRCAELALDGAGELRFRLLDRDGELVPSGERVRQLACSP